ncbi:MAG: ATPase domain-containing protein [Candidatus Hodarchaeota archaeon]
MKLRLGNNGNIHTLSPLLDDLLDGGFQYNTMSHYYGMSGTGKTIFAMQLSLTTIHNGHKVIWIDLNKSFDFNRLIQMNHDDKSIASQIKLFRPQSYKKNMELVKDLENHITEATKLIVLDPFTYFYRLNLKESVEFRARRDLFNIQLPILARIVLTYDLHIILINQTRASFIHRFDAVGGKRTDKFCKYVLEFRYNSSDNKRYITIRKHFRKKGLIGLSCKINKYGFYGFEKC